MNGEVSNGKNILYWLERTRRQKMPIINSEPKTIWIIGQWKEFLCLIIDLLRKRTASMERNFIERINPALIQIRTKRKEKWSKQVTSG